MLYLVQSGAAVFESTDYSLWLKYIDVVIHVLICNEC